MMKFAFLIPNLFRQKPFLAWLLLAIWAGVSSSCTSRSYTHYLIDDPVFVNESIEIKEPPLAPYRYESKTPMIVRWNNGTLLTEVEVPLLTSAQRIVVQHDGGAQGSKVSPGSAVLPPQPTLADETLAEAYREKGLKENKDVPDVSLSKSQQLVQDAIAGGNYALALQYIQAVLDRYPSHPIFLRAKGSVLLLMGEREKAIELYEQAEEIESDPLVRQKLKELQETP